MSQRGVRVRHFAGAALGLLAPTVCVAALSIPHLFEAGTPVSSKQMNENFAAVGEAIDGVAARKPGIPLQLGPGLSFAQQMMIFQASETGIFYARSGGSNHGDLTLVLRVGDGRKATDPAVLTCGDADCGMPVRAHYANSADILVPAGAFVQVEASYPAESTALVTLFWQPSDAGANAMPEQIYPAP